MANASKDDVQQARNDLGREIGQLRDSTKFQVDDLKVDMRTVEGDVKDAKECAMKAKRGAVRWSVLLPIVLVLVGIAMAVSGFLWGSNGKTNDLATENAKAIAVDSKSMEHLRGRQEAFEKVMTAQTTILERIDKRLEDGGDGNGGD